MPNCIFDIAWVGKCKKPAISEEGSMLNTPFCAEHHGKKCVSCGVQATRECDHTGIQFVCGSHLCNNCAHAAPERGKEGMFMLGGGHKPREQAEASWKERIAELDRKDGY